ncbi:rCG63100 [Rattus norvegicus]|uniref:RCG63100 n=1 Tax=Rattus norvegicus TaxID=10116 RepID=A6KSL2_RAT|nr:rCG63100 [Rattus norvegicus]
MAKLLERYYYLGIHISYLIKVFILVLNWWPLSPRRHLVASGGKAATDI